MMPFRKILLLVSLMALSAGAMASECDADLAKVDAEIVSTNPLPADTVDEASGLRNEAYALCESGDIATGMGLLAQSKQLLGIAE